MLANYVCEYKCCINTLNPMIGQSNVVKSFVLILGYYLSIMLFNQ